MASREDLQGWILNALTDLGGQARIARICQHIWDNHEGDLRASGDLFYTWQYEMRWAGQILDNKGMIKKLSTKQGWLKK